MTEDPNKDATRDLTRRHFFRDCGVGLGKIALASLLVDGGRIPARESERGGPGSPLAPRPPHFRARVRSVIYLFMAGAPSQLDLFDEKPLLKKYEGQPIPPDVVKDQRYAFIRRDASLLGPRFGFRRHGASGALLSEVIPHLASVADDIAIVRSMHTDQFNHAPAQLFMNSGSGLPGRPSMGSWVVYGLGSEADDLPAFVVLSTGGGTSAGAANWSAGFLPGVYAGVPLRSGAEPILYLSNPPGVTRGNQRRSLDLIQTLNRRRLQALGDPQIATRIEAYETAFRMQTRAPELVDLGRESAATLELYGAEPGKASFANHCLLARRMVERGVRFINIYHRGWDAHSDVAGNLRTNCGLTDRASAALLIDLKRRGLLDETLVVWGGEFGRTPMVESSAALKRKLGRDHHPQAFTMWLAGGGVRAGTNLGETDDLGFHIVRDPVHVHDLQATILRLLGLDHERLTFFHQGREFRLTDVHGKVVEELLA